MAPPYNNRTTVQDLSADYASIIKGKTILTTGVTPGGLGAVFVSAIAASQPALLILAGCNTTKTQQTAAAITSQHPEVKTQTLDRDLSSVEAVRRAAAEVCSWNDVPVVDVLVNNAAVMAIEHRVTEDGFEMQLATGHLGHFLFTNLIMGKLLAAKAPRVVSVSSDGHRLSGMRWTDPHFSDGKTYNKWIAYGQAKTANVLFALGLAQKLGKKGLHAYSVHPGVILTTGLGVHLDTSENGDFAALGETDRMLGNAERWKEFPEGWKDSIVTADAGAATHAFAAFDPSIEDSNGAYLLKCRLADPYVDTVKPWAVSNVQADKLWKLSEELVGQEFIY